MHPRWLIGIALPFLLFAFIQQNALKFVFGAPWSFTRSVEVKKAGQDRGYYYRFKASYTYKGEPLDFDIVVGCNVNITTYKDNGRTVEIGVTPTVFGVKMKDGRGVVVRPPEACRGETTENGGATASLLPLVVTYENADQPWSGLAYASEDAYDSPISELKFFGATISSATFEEWQEWRRTEAPKNFITYELLGINTKNKWDTIRWKPGYRAMASECVGFSWVKLPEPVREAMRPYWPASRPRYWYPNSEARSTFYSAGDYHLGWVRFEGYALHDYLGLWPGEKGLPRHSRGGEISYTGRVSGDVYPATSDISLNRLDEAGELPLEIKAKAQKSYADVTVDPKFKGFAHCDTVPYVADTPATIHDAQGLTVRINGEEISYEALKTRPIGLDYAFERDEYVVIQKRYQVVNAVFGGL